MNRVLGLPKERAIEALASQGVKVRLTEVRSRKGCDGTDERVVRVRRLAEDEVELTVSRFRTE